ncbi:MAG: transcription antitermination factor NusB [Chthoniobacterales bacterium]
MRHDGREAAIQYLYLRDINRGMTPLEALENFWKIRNAPDETRKFCEDLVAGVVEHQEEIDGRIDRHTQHYDINRLSAVDRNILRLAIYEMLHRQDIPPAVSINEAIEVAKNLGSQDSGRFVNGILDSIRIELGLPKNEKNEK